MAGAEDGSGSVSIHHVGVHYYRSVRWDEIVSTYGGVADTRVFCRTVVLGVAGSLLKRLSDDVAPVVASLDCGGTMGSVVVDSGFYVEPSMLGAMTVKGILAIVLLSLGTLRDLESVV